MDTKRDKDFLEKYYRKYENKKNILIVGGTGFIGSNSGSKSN